MIWFVVAAAIVVFLILLTAFICYMKVFYAPPFKKPGENEYEIPEGEIYEVFRDEMVGWVKEVRAMNGEQIKIRSFDGLTLSGRYYEYEKGAITEMLFHGYQGYAEDWSKSGNTYTLVNSNSNGADRLAYSKEVYEYFMN